MNKRNTMRLVEGVHLSTLAMDGILRVARERRCFPKEVLEVMTIDAIKEQRYDVTVESDSRSGGGALGF